MQSTIETPIKPVNEPCKPVKVEIGEEPELAGDVEFADVFESVSSTLVDLTRVPYQEHISKELGKIIDRGESARNVQTDLGCAGCKLSGVCLVESALNDVIASGELAQERESKLEFAQQGIDYVNSFSSLMSLAYSKEATKLVRDEGRTESIPKLLWGVAARVMPRIKGADVTEISGLAAVDGTKDCPRYEISVENNTFIIIDASDALEVNGINPPNESRTKVLFNKFFERLRSVDVDKQPHLATPDGTQQKKIESIESMEVHEIRMAGKNRLYFAIKHEDSKSRYRIIILGAHDDNENHQQAFIDNLA